jgi:hypothetical protein
MLFSKARWTRIPSHQFVAMADDILEQLLRNDENFATAGGHKIIEIDTYVVHLLPLAR